MPSPGRSGHPDGLSEPVATLGLMPGVFDRLVGQRDVEAELVAAATAARTGEPGSAMTHSWLFTGPPGSGRSIAALCFAAALQCTDPDMPGCGSCHACTTTMAGTHGDVRRVVPEGLTIVVKEIRDIVQVASMQPTTGRWQVVVVEDADRLTEGAANALLKSVEEPSKRTVFLLCAPSVDPEDISVTLRSRCRHIGLVTPSVDAIARVLRTVDGIDERAARWAASVSGGHVGRARRFATDETARENRKRALGLAYDVLRPATTYSGVDDLGTRAEAETAAVSAARDERELEELKIALGGGGTGKGAAGALRGSAGMLKELEKTQKTRRTRTQRDIMDRALVDLAGLYRDALACSFGASTTPNHPDMAERALDLASRTRPERLLDCIEAILECREALDRNVKPRFALAAMAARLSGAFR